MITALALSEVRVRIAKGRECVRVEALILETGEQGEIDAGTTLDSAFVSRTVGIDKQIVNRGCDGIGNMNDIGVSIGTTFGQGIN